VPGEWIETAVLVFDEQCMNHYDEEYAKQMKKAEKEARVKGKGRRR